MDGLDRLGCFDGYASAQVGAVEKKPEKLNEICQHGNIDDQKVCIEAIIERLADYQEPQAYAACTFVEGELNEFCNRAADRKYYSVDKSFELYFEE